VFTAAVVAELAALSGISRPERDRAGRLHNDVERVTPSLDFVMLIARLKRLHLLLVRPSKAVIFVDLVPELSGNSTSEQWDKSKSKKRISIKGCGAPGMNMMGTQIIGKFQSASAADGHNAPVSHLELDG
jgi:hypothetical protein